VSTAHDKLLEELRPGAFAIAYRMLGSVAEAEDVVQESLLRVHSALTAGERIESPRAYVATIATRLAIDELRSARARRESYVGEWLPEPLVTDPAGDPPRQAELSDSLSLAFLVLLESLSPDQTSSGTRPRRRRPGAPRPARAVRAPVSLPDPRAGACAPAQGSARRPPPRRARPPCSTIRAAAARRCAAGPRTSASPPGTR
jgi:RNA polymerase sigma factor (sigma-70 family)